MNPKQPPLPELLSRYLARQASAHEEGLGLADVGGNALYVGARALLALGLAAALSGIYPLFTMLLARVILRERLPRLGLAGVGFALIAIVLISAG